MTQLAWPELLLCSNASFDWLNFAAEMDTGTIEINIKYIARAIKMDGLLE